MQAKIIHSLLTLYKVKNISKASEILFITQQGLSRQIKALEEELGVSLFLRKKDGVIPTEICHRLIPAFNKMQEAYIDVLNIIDQQQPHKLRIGFAYGISHGLNNDFLVTYQKAFPNVCLEIQEWTGPACQNKLLTGELDLAILIEPFDKSSLNYHQICQDSMFAAMHVTHPFAGTKEPLPFQALANEPIITGSYDNALRRFFDYCCKLTRIQPPILMSSSYNVDFVNSMTRNTGISTLTSAMSFRITNPEVFIRKLILPVPGNIYICVSVRNKDLSVIKQFISFCREYFRQNPLPAYEP